MSSATLSSVPVASTNTQRSGSRWTISRNASRSLVWNARSKSLEARLAGIPRRGACEARFRRQVEHKRQFGLEGMRGRRFDPADGFAVEAPSRALIGISRIREAIGDHPFAGGQCGLDRAADMVRACREQQQRFRHRIPAAGLAFDEELADLFRARRPARFARDKATDAARFKRRRQSLGLRRLAGTLPAFQRDEAGRHCVALRPEISARIPKERYGRTSRRWAPRSPHTRARRIRESRVP